MINKLYDAKASAESLNKIQASREKDRPMQTQVKELCGITGWQDFIEVNKFNEPTAWRMTWHQEGYEREEIQLHIQGVLEDKRLPPIKIVRSKKHIQHVKQSVTLSGLGSKRFNEDINTVIGIYAMLARQVGNLEGFEIKELGGRRMLKIGNRIFTLKWEAPNMEWFTPLHEVDPEGSIEVINTEDNNFIHGAENVVDYREEKTEGEGEKKTYMMNPQKFHVGDIVDVAFLIVGIPTKQGARAFLVLQSVTLLDGTHTQVRNNNDEHHKGTDGTQNWIKAQACGKMTGNARLQLKKRSAFDDETEKEVEEARKKLRQLAVNEKAKMDKE
ncbi:hypothetical protein GYMLUDRAFT_60445 [Collybiopsis luxurians FD-317 M1]|uniref:Uncharacterized protein n=1 Tax=Collybiopsis luxurians FD-317 M1 TaxID=944289 RepID=A0A0D0C904_9AGAR|nr:hypothetical protein GYMLUDRAFT_60445 [Collybiopsis luxurians FD-317 M1]